MKKTLIFLFFIFSICIAYSQNKEIEQIIQNRTIEASQNMAQLVINGQIDYPDNKYPLDFISISLLNKKELRTLRNSIFARYGYIFKSKDLQDYFSNFSWYNAKSTNVNDLLTDVDKKNIKRIQSFEAMDSNIIDVISAEDIVGLWHISLIMPSGFASVFQFYPNKTFEYKYSQMRELPIIISFSGAYEIKGNMLILNSNKKKMIQHTDETSWSAGYGYQWENEQVFQDEQNKIYRFPISKVLTVGDIYNDYPPSMKNREVIIIGSIPFFKYSDNPDSYN